MEGRQSHTSASTLRYVATLLTSCECAMVVATECVCVSYAPVCVFLMRVDGSVGR